MSSELLYAREVVMLTAGLLSKRAATAAFERDSDAMTQNELQFIYFLASVRTTFDRAGVRLRLVTNPVDMRPESSMSDATATASTDSRKRNTVSV